ncbi:hypothetical protein IMZ11_33135 [Microtetraspora sp. AC03309]|uniref:hypothetical protein n=1 Tax=Microtetraspora sp. AC03309 TaxID=2779376 RepID=UPI001E557EEA|nr:hypothetical protein [Microtetraspora sp. AC03309]MCC5580475.1 hypothetical protein [Microtetraspora sp. AC03309]
MNLTDLARVRDEELAGQASTPEAWTLLASIVSEEHHAPAARRRAPWRALNRRRSRAQSHAPSRFRVRGRKGRALALGAVSVGLGLAVAIGVGLPGGGPAIRYANAAVSIERATDHFSVTITDPVADPRRFEEAFRAVGLNVTVKVIPVPPANVGRLVGPIVPEGFRGPGSIGIQSVEPCASAFCGKVWMPAHYSGRVVFGVGRPAAPGEPYVDDVVDPSSAEALDGYRSHGRTVAEVRDELHRRRLKVGYRLYWILSEPGRPDKSFFDQRVTADRIEDDWVVEGSRHSSSDTVDLYVVPGPEAGPAPDPMTVHDDEPHWYDQTD